MTNSEVFYQLSEDILRRGYQVRFCARGQSMQPTIREGETITVAPVTASDVSRGDVLLYRGTRGITAHRVVRIEPGQGDHLFILRGDMTYTCDAPVAARQVLGRVVGVDRSGRSVPIARRPSTGAQAMRVCVSRLVGRCRLRRRLCWYFLLLAMLLGLSRPVQALMDSGSSGCGRVLWKNIVLGWLVLCLLHWSLTLTGGMAWAAGTTEGGVQRAEDAVAQTIVISAQVRVPLSIIQGYAPEDAKIQELQAAVERQAELALDAYQNAAFAETAEMAQAAGAVAEAAAMAAQVQSNVIVAQTQMRFMLAEDQGAAGLTVGQRQEATDAAQRAAQRAAGHGVAAEELVWKAVALSQQLEGATTAEEVHQLASLVQAVRDTVLARAVASGAQVVVVQAYTARDPEIVRRARLAARAAEEFLAATEALVGKAETASEPAASDPTAKVRRRAQAALVETRVTAVGAQATVAWARRKGLEGIAVANAAALKAAAQVQVAAQASQRAAEAPTVAAAQAATMSADIAAVTAAAEARVAMARVMVAIAEAQEGTSTNAASAQAAAATQLQVAIALAGEAEDSAALVHTAAAQILGDEALGLGGNSAVELVAQALVAQTQRQAQLAISWAQSATGWAQAALAWTQSMEETAVAAEAAAVAAESSATRTQAAVAAAITAATPAAASTTPAAAIVSVAAPLLAQSRVSQTTTAEPVASSEAEEAASSEDEELLLPSEEETVVVEQPPLPIASPSR